MRKTRAKQERLQRRPDGNAQLLRLLQRGIDHQRAGQFKEAEYHYQLVLRQDPNHADALNLLGTLAAEAKLYDRSVDYLERAVKLRPKDPMFRNNLANGYILDRRHEEAIPHLRRAIKAKPRFVEALCNLGRACRGLGKAAQAVEWFDKALACDEANMTALLGRADALAELGRMDEASQAYLRLLRHHPHEPNAYIGLSSVRKFKPDDPEIAEIENRLSANGIGDQERELLHFAAGKIYNDMKRFDDAFAHFQSAKTISGADFDVAGYATFVDRQMALFTEPFFAQRRDFGDPSERPVFIVGMPRSGTTLTEQIVASHPAVHGAGELLDLQSVVRGLAGPFRNEPSYFERLAKVDAAQAAEGARAYLSALKRHSSSALRVTDKMPHNFEALGVVAMLFPNARVIHCRRNPLDNCVSCFTHRFNTAHGYNADLAKLGLYYRQYSRLMAHWHAVLPIDMLELRYEDMIADQEGSTRRLIAFLGLDWDDACLTYYDNERAVKTLSLWQVRQPIYASSVERWRNFEHHLAPLIDALGEHAAGAR